MGMKPHAWNVTPKRAIEIQSALQAAVSRRNSLVWQHLRFVGGVDISVQQGQANAAIVVLSFPDLETVETATYQHYVPFPYVPGLLSFRECPAILEAYAKLKTQPDVLLLDGQGIAHPRRFGLASHLGVLLDRPTIGCAKRRFIGTYAEPDVEAGYYTDLWDGDELIGAVLRTRSHVKPMYISIGHRVDLPTALDVVLNSCLGYRLPEPTRRAHHVAGGSLRLPRHRD